MKIGDVSARLTAIGDAAWKKLADIGHVVINLPLCFSIIYSQMGDHQVNIERAAAYRRTAQALNSAKLFGSRGGLV